MEKQKRSRGLNYSNEEKSLLLNLVSDLKHIVENKKTDCTTNKQKEQTWELIAKLFNARAPNGVVRNIDSLKKFYDNIKKKTRFDVATYKMEAIKTGGGQGTEIKDPNHELAMSIMNEKTVFGLENIFDSDALENENLGNKEDEYILSNKDKKNNISQTNTSEALLESNKASVGGIEADWGDWSAKNLSTTANKELQTKRPTWEQRRRPNIVDNLQETHINLAIAKIELAKMQLKILQEEHNIKNDRDEKEFKLKIRSLELEIQLKEAQLKLVE